MEQRQDDATPDAGVNVSRMPQNLQLKILSMVAARPPPPPPPSGGSPAPASRRPLSPAAAAGREDYAAWTLGLATRLSAHGYAWQDEMMPPAPAASLLSAVRDMPDGVLRPAGMSSSLAKWHDPTVRGDSTVWVPLETEAVGGDGGDEFAALHASVGWSHYRAILHSLVESLNREGGVEGDAVQLPAKVMLAHYPVGAKYVRHSDVSAAVAHRRATAILYLNEG